MLPATATPPSVGPVRGTAFRLLLLATAIATLMVGLTPPPAQAAPAQPARITLSSTSGEPGTPVAVTGAGFPKRSKGMVVAGSARVTITTTSTGSFQASIVMPAQPGQVSVTATVGAAVATVSFTVVEPAPVSDSPTSLRFGIGTNGGPSAGGELDEVAALAGEAPSIVLSYKDFNQPAPIAELDAARARGAETLLTWEPWTWGGGTSQPAYSLDRIAAGDYDAYLREWGTTLATWGQPVYLRFAHEMNGDWYPWAEGVNGNGPGDYIAAYRHVHDVVASTGASNISWVWSPNVPYWGSTPLEALYPGPGYADVVALDGYNWGTSQSWSGWQEPEALFGEGLAQLRTLAPGVPIMIAETASAETGGSKAQWITDLFGYLSAQQDVMGLVWFHINKEADWRINSTTASAEAFRAGLASRR